MSETDRVQIFNSLSKNRRKLFVERMCGSCFNLKWDEEKERYWCEAFTSFHFLWGHGECPAKAVDETALAQECFEEDKNRELLKAGKGEKSDRTHKIFGKERMKDNRFPMWDGDLS